MFEASLLRKKGLYVWSNTRPMRVIAVGGIPEHYMEQLLMGQTVAVYVQGCLKAFKRDIRAAGLECSIENTGREVRRAQIRVIPEGRSEEDRIALSKRGWRA